MHLDICLADSAVAELNKLYVEKAKKEAQKAGNFFIYICTYVSYQFRLFFIESKAKETASKAVADEAAKVTAKIKASLAAKRYFHNSYILNKKVWIFKCIFFVGLQELLVLQNVQNSYLSLQHF